MKSIHLIVSHKTEIAIFEKFMPKVSKKFNIKKLIVYRSHIIFNLEISTIYSSS